VGHPEAGEALALFIVQDGDEDRSMEAVVDSVRRALPAQWICASVKVVAELPRTANGKVARAQLHTFA
jgi:acyl-CoA synthetase (AMP-forming)/AMP-acid ligase II